MLLLILSKIEGRHSIVISEIPYALKNKASLIEKIADLVKEKIVGIADLRDESIEERSGMLLISKDAILKKID